jgi:hypothetical protein
VFAFHLNDTERWPAASSAQVSNVRDAGFRHRSIGFAIPAGRNGIVIFRPSPADAYAA